MVPTVAKANCVGCHKVVDASWGFCPFCGTDNRDPSLHQGSVGNHNHDFRFGSHCVLCGTAGAGQQYPTTQPRPPASSSGSIVLSDGVIMKSFGVLFIAAAILGTVLVASTRQSNGPPLVFAIPFLSLFAIVGVLVLFYVRDTIFDLQSRTITLKRGYTFAPKTETCGFDDVNSLRFEKYHVSGQGASLNQNCTLTLMRGSNGTLLKSYYIPWPGSPGL